MGKDSDKNIVGQPIFNQILQMLPGEAVNKIVLEEQSDRYYKSFRTWDELASLLFGVFTRCDSAREVCDEMAALGGKLNYSGRDRSPAQSAFNDGLNRRSEGIFEKIYFGYWSIISRPFRRTAEKRGFSLRSFTPSTPQQAVCFRTY
jgi:hypothetical protein